MLSIRTAKVISVVERGPGLDTDLVEVDTRPDFIDVTLEGVDCSVQDFLAWFMKTEFSADFSEKETGLIYLEMGHIAFSRGDEIVVKKLPTGEYIAD